MFKRQTGNLPNPANRQTILSGAQGPVHLMAGPGGDIFYAGLDDGKIHRIQYSTGNLPPPQWPRQAHAGIAPLSVSFNATGSTDPEGQTLSYAWDLDGDGAFDDSTSRSPIGVYSTPAVYNGGACHGQSGTHRCGVDRHHYEQQRADATIDSPRPRSSGRWATSLRSPDSATDREDGTLPPSALSGR